MHNSVAIHYPAQLRAEFRPVQRMSHGAYQPAHGAARQTRVGVERDHITNALQRMLVLPGNFHERSFRRATQQMIEFLELPAFALPAHPLIFFRVPLALAMEQEKSSAAGRRPVALVQIGDGGNGGLQQFIVAARGFGIGIGPVGEQRKPQIAVWIRQVVNFEIVYISLRALGRSQQRRHHHDRAQRVRHSRAEFHSRQRPRSQ